SIPDILVEKQIRQGSDNQNVGIKRLQKSRNTPDEFRQLKTRKGAGDSNEAIKDGGVKTAFLCKTGYQQRADLICAVEIEHSFPVQKNSRKEVV
ncbi:MAG: hypothetical protein ACLQDM_03465, partial [Bradyrhizobium sp.]